ncbi:glycoside hydrolase domain-containing protein [Terribacillus aidingensis]|uniref:glycoside hydrolase domain-containing protein n=1 Tax=Terribacillus aidingensis TaxID=586416 RepID=UPI00344DAA2E
MADEMLRETQIWLNKTYSGVTGFNKVPEDGQTRNKTYYGLIRALQIELGITNLADSFGNQTMAAFSDISRHPVGSVPSNMVYILQGGFWTKGYNPGGFSGLFYEDTENAVKRFQRDIGIEQTGIVTGQVMKALLNTDGYELSSLGTADMRSVQQFLNANYGGMYFTYVPTNGVYERNTNKALIYGLQAEMGMSPNVANGNFGPGTTNGCPVLSVGNTGNNVKILQGALLGNGYDTIGFNGVDGNFDNDVRSKVIEFQKDLALPQTGIADMPTIKQLLSSAGHTGRKATVCDTATILNSSNIQTIINNGYKMVGRYLTGTVGGTRSKALTRAELNLMFSKGLKVFPIYQDGGYYSDYFVAGQGIVDANNAISAARALGFKSGTTIYFAVDFDAYDFEVKQKIVPYFQEISSTFNRMLQYSDVPAYKIGIYGPRNSCIQVSEQGYAEHSFVSNMSTGFSGNLGYPMPSNWSFSQFYEYTIYSGQNESLPIDKVDTSGRDAGVSSITTPHNSEESAFRQAWAVVGSRLPYVTSDPSLFSTEFVFDRNYRVLDSPAFTVDVIASRIVKIGESENAVTVTNGQIGLSIAQAAEELQGKISTTRLDTAEGFMRNLALGIGNGEMEVEFNVTAEGLAMKFIGRKFDLPSSAGTDAALQVAVTLTFRNLAPDIDLTLLRENLVAAGKVATVSVAAGVLLYATVQSGGSAAPLTAAAMSSLLVFLGMKDEDDEDNT